MPYQPHQVAVVIPIYKKEPSEYDLISIRQTINVLARYDLVIIAPEGLSLAAYETLYPDFQVLRFAPRYFEGVSGYNRLMLSSRFYRAFRGYAYMLICQTDAYVFRDELLMWCNKEYDYIGAPFLEAMPVTLDRPVIFDLSKRLLGKVGNGGFSLRKVRTHLQVTRWFRWLTAWFPKNEDLFWCYLLPYLYPYHRPGAEEAVYFAFDLAPRKAFAMTGGQLPFGCHAWQRFDTEFWVDYIPFSH